jgi:ribosomal protein L24E
MRDAMTRVETLGLFIALLFAATTTAAPTADQAKAKEALKELQEYIGGWKGSGQTKPRPSPRDPFWAETVDWSWRFKKDDAWLAVSTKGGKFIKSGELRYLPPKKLYQLTVTTPEKKTFVFTGKIKDEKLILERLDKDAKEIQQIKMFTTVEGARFNYLVARKADGGTIWKQEYIVGATKIGESLGKAEKKNVCVVSGGVGTMEVKYNGEIYYVCCSGCADAFKENPKKYVDEFKAKKGKK